ncbi:DDB1- and CUL4-associated factor 1 [Aplysia californica]|uniref:DDB1- and CUL4-associated factor 1 n=1 Tax=Aplysia californica TaxID=6500 RepID=A0ABM1W4Y5_APLCA|nr:DDB1- and CUL4-associated factor 1 [Aplysia californica]XP_035829726.1 DDB1- and CUL4-associated factor 1 [Aplysia californica]XP_035829727.1 DDB1- and CUL4-associated factor 1 [Aplysia californica]XP_035829728.1 DDB1- and CUL4-associated factor 1 [Aplysia californica]
MAPQGDDSLATFQATLEDWNAKFSSEANFDPIPILNKLAQLLEHATEDFYKMDPDPLDDRPPGRQIPTCGLGQMMKVIFKNEDFMNTIVGSYLLKGSYRDGGPIFTAACRVLLVLLPGLETSVPFRETEGVVERLCHWTEFADEPLKSYATGLLGGAMELNDIAVRFRDESLHLVPIMLNRLHELMAEAKKEVETQKEQEGLSSIEETGRSSKEEVGKSPRHFASLATGETPASVPRRKDMSPASASEKGDYRGSLKRSLSPSHSFSVPKRSRTSSENLSFFDPEHSNSSWAEIRPYVIGTYCLEPLSVSMKQRLILQYLTPLGDYHELLSPILAHNALDLIFFYINLNENRDVRLAFEALRFLSVILCHKKFAAEFISKGGIQKLLEIHRPSIAATGVSLCFYYITYFEDATERLSMLPESVLSDVVSYNLWLMECSHDSSTCHACLFFSQSFTYKVILRLFDQKDGMRKLINVISTLSIHSLEGANDESEDALHQMRQRARLVCGTLRMYFKTHNILKADELRRVHHHEGGSSSVREGKCVKDTKHSMEEEVDVLLNYLPPRSDWLPEILINKLGGLSILCQHIALSPTWENYQGKTDTIVAALDVLSMCSVSHRTQLLLNGNVSLRNNVVTPIMCILVRLAEGEVVSDAEIQKSALRVICNCVCGPFERFGNGVLRYHPSSSRKKNNSGEEDLLSTMWNSIRTNNGIMVVLKLLSVKTPITDADAIRTLACKALVGMSRSETIRQIIGKLPPLNNGQLQSLMKEPVLSDYRQIHIQFCKYASTLLEKIAGRQANILGAATLEEIRKASVVAQTKIVFQDKELLQLIHEHLISKGLYEAATALQKEASLPKCATPPPHPPSASSHIYSPTTPKMGRQLSQPAATNGAMPSQSSREIFPSTPGSSSQSPCSNSTITAATAAAAVTPTTSSTPSSSSDRGFAPIPGPSQVKTPACPSSSSVGTPGHIKFTLNKTPNNTHQPAALPPKSTKRRFLKDREGYVPAGGLSRTKTSEYDISLDKIVTEYLRKQHALCPQPISTCPTMSLFVPHRCPEPLGKTSAPYSVCTRMFERQIRAPYGGVNGHRLDRRHVHSKLHPIQTFRDGSGDGLACCSFDFDSDSIFIGSFAGDLRVMRLYASENEYYSTVCHSSPIIHISTSKVNPNLLFTSTWGASQNCALWSYNRDGPDMNLKYRLDEYTAVLANRSSERFIGTKEMVAKIYDTSTGSVVQTLYDEGKANNYKFNEATFSPTDDLVLNDGNLWDVRTNKMVYKFDKFNQYTSGCFHPGGLEVVINSEIWDMRTFRLLHTVPALDQCQIMFNNNGDIIYAVRVDDEPSETVVRRDYASTLRTFDATDYTSIGTFDLKTNSIFDVAVDRNDLLLGIVENASNGDTDSEEAFCRIYELGKTREPEDQIEDDDDNPQNDEPDDYDDDDDEDDEDDEDDDDLDIDDPILDFVEASDNESDGDNNQDGLDVAELSPIGSSDDGNDDDDDDEDDALLDDLLFELV